eukprot:TRINITY_DN6847_c0_g1_i1.p1 TRINITY_DN6847_c0_g1~~TRINITY_DN6847_c0_g1_i1.p1  ORF type:complete len:1111 (-),score=212.21 TRINITY_DN6847_c0_g1_i1:39-3371(-)
MEGEKLGMSRSYVSDNNLHRIISHFHRELPQDPALAVQTRYLNEGALKDVPNVSFPSRDYSDEQLMTWHRVGLIGETQDGKSTLINSLISDHKQPILPEGKNDDACTKFPIEVVWSDREGYSITPFYVQASGFNTFIQGVQQNLLSNKEPFHELKYEMERLKAVYPNENLERIRAIDLERLTELAFGNLPSTIQCSLEEVAEKVVSLKTKFNGREIWPLITKVRIEGPFQHVPPGVVLVDVPGYNDSKGFSHNQSGNFLTLCQTFIISSPNLHKTSAQESIRAVLANAQKKERVFVALTKSDDVHWDSKETDDDDTLLRYLFNSLEAKVLTAKGKIEEIFREPDLNQTLGTENHLRSDGITILPVMALSYRKLLASRRGIPILVNNEVPLDRELTGIPELRRLVFDQISCFNRNNLRKRKQFATSKVTEISQNIESIDTIQSGATEDEERFIGNVVRKLDEETAKILSQAESVLNTDRQKIVNSLTWDRIHGNTWNAIVRKNGIHTARSGRDKVNYNLHSDLSNAIANRVTQSTLERLETSMPRIIAALNLNRPQRLSTAIEGLLATTLNHQRIQRCFFQEGIYNYIYPIFEDVLNGIEGLSGETRGEVSLSVDPLVRRTIQALNNELVTFANNMRTAPQTLREALLTPGRIEITFDRARVQRILNNFLIELNEGINIPMENLTLQETNETFNSGPWFQVLDPQKTLEVEQIRMNLSQLDLSIRVESFRANLNRNPASVWSPEISRVDGEDMTVLLLLKQFSNATIPQIQSRMMVRNVGVDNERIGIDAGGLTRELLEIVGRYSLLPSRNLPDNEWNLSLFRPIDVNNATSFYINPYANSYVDNDGMLFHGFGRLIGKAFIDDRILPVSFSLALYKAMTGERLSASDWNLVSSTTIPEFYEGLEFEPMETEWRQMRTFNNIPTASEPSRDWNLFYDGEVIRTEVTRENYPQWVERQAAFKLVKSVLPSLKSLLRGIHEVVPVNLLALFSAQELRDRLEGCHSITADSLLQRTSFDQGIPVHIQNWFVNEVRTMNSSELEKLLQYATGCSRMPQGNGITLNVKVGNFNTIDHLPAAHTCFNALDLGNYSSQQKLGEKLRLAFENHMTISAN